MDGAASDSAPSGGRGWTELTWFTMNLTLNTEEYKARPSGLKADFDDSKILLYLSKNVVASPCGPPNGRVQYGSWSSDDRPAGETKSKDSNQP